jgi:hypothetical protein
VQAIKTSIFILFYFLQNNTKNYKTATQTLLPGPTDPQIPVPPITASPGFKGILVVYEPARVRGRAKKEENPLHAHPLSRSRHVFFKEFSVEL